ncbi:hypothetical protein [Adlercreutzia sp. ZJ138]|uniref:hypothetical protein n=1 Tax=Adlercreutzia sp. ZJ138 TaxID=2709405 RepID=UPI0013EC2965|nr:hypothetical protein [Adlercreutzia sp. ZJ138]
MAIQVETHDGLTRTYSDAGYYIIQNENGAEYQEAWDPIDYPRTYTESTHIIEVAPEPDPIDNDKVLVQAAKIMLGGE